MQKDQVVQENMGKYGNLLNFHANAQLFQAGVLPTDALIPYVQCHSRKSIIVDGHNIEKRDQLGQILYMIRCMRCSNHQRACCFLL